jgi:hypothetical protein
MKTTMPWLTALAVSTLTVLAQEPPAPEGQTTTPQPVIEEQAVKYDAPTSRRTQRLQKKLEKIQAENRARGIVMGEAPQPVEPVVWTPELEAQVRQALDEEYARLDKRPKPLAREIVFTMPALKPTLTLND